MRIRVLLMTDEQGTPVKTDLELPDGATAHDAAKKLVAARGAGFGRMLWGDDGQWRVIVFVNRKDAAPQTPLHDGDELAFLPPITGGAG